MQSGSQTTDGDDSRKDGHGGDLIDDWARVVIRWKAQKLCERTEFASTDAEDIEQHLLLTLCIKLRGFDKSRSQLHTFVTRILDSEIASILRERYAAKRDYRREAHSLDEPVSDQDGICVERHNVTPEQPDVRRDQVELRIDIAEILAAMPAEMRSVAIGLKTRTVNSVSKQTGLSRRRVCAYMDDIRELFEDADLGRYL